MDLKSPDARVYGYLAWQRYSSVVPNGMYQDTRTRRPTASARARTSSTGRTSRTATCYVQEPQLLEDGAAVPGRDHVQGHHRRAVPDRRPPRRSDRGRDRLGRQRQGAARRQRAHGAHGLTAAFREIQFTIKDGENKPWADKLVRQAVNFAINRQDIIDKVYGGIGQYSGHVAAGYGPWAIPQAELKRRTRSTTSRRRSR